MFGKGKVISFHIFLLVISILGVLLFAAIIGIIVLATSGSDSNDLQEFQKKVYISDTLSFTDPSNDPFKLKIDIRSNQVIQDDSEVAVRIITGKMDPFLFGIQFVGILTLKDNMVTKTIKNGTIILKYLPENDIFETSYENSVLNSSVMQTTNIPTDDFIALDRFIKTAY